MVFCKECNKKFTFGKGSKDIEIARRHLEDSSSFRVIQKRNGYSKTSSCKKVLEIASGVKSSYWIAKNLKPKWSGILCFDGTYLRVRNYFADIDRKLGRDERFLHKMCALLSIDYHTRDLPHYSLGENENMIDLVIHFSQLKENGYIPRVLIRDGNKTIQKAIEHVYGKSMISQLCQKHFLDKFDERINSREIEKEDRKSIIELKNRVCQIIRIPDIDISIKRMNDFIKNQNQFRASANASELIDKFIENYESLTMYLQYKKGYIPRTINVSENLNMQLKKRTKLMCSFQSINSAENYLNMWCLRRRFQKFTDCKKPHKKLNNLSPLELAGVSIKNLDYLKL